ncbi:acyl-CoA dehydrogenase [Qipengyuania atrilutea]|uniref:Acyl-CoA dehydrogenase n=1 Tax=Qipengyuania atrilutea TaxID=2744473 RepID=A0A850H0A1_9SPHN|nr:acyl-CoA dehydrogenase [Actirhodobacter atriluteus]NVD45311.1 acyl-CoA dehydrogenase [Actirhodobacter atriluteus]
MPDSERGLREFEGAIEQIAERARDTDRTDGDLRPDIEVLRRSGWLSACLSHKDGGKGWGSEPEGSLPALDALRVLGRANLSVARLFEGHMNAVKLIALYGDARQRELLAKDVANGALLGVWGADEPGSPVSCEQDANGVKLTGAKRFASGMGLVDQAIVTADTEHGPSMFLVPVDDEERADAGVWKMAGMRATRSGRYTLENLTLSSAARIGEEGNYLREPFFEGGIWRYCAAHLGGAEALYREMMTQLTKRDRTDNTEQRQRVVACAIALETSRLWLERCALEIEADGAAPRKVLLALLAREVTENACRETMELVDRALGMAAHEEGGMVERMSRDLSLFLCQAGPDAKRERAGRGLFSMGKLAEAI